MFIINMGGSDCPLMGRREWIGRGRRELLGMVGMVHVLIGRW